MPSSKKIKSQRKEDLRKRNLGVGIGKIDVDEVEKSTNKKITFDDDFVASDYESDDENDASNNEDEGDQDSDEDSSDDEVEQVSASTAKQQAMEMRAAERKTRKEETALSHKRKRKTKANEKEMQVMTMPEMSDSEDDDLDDDMLELIDSERKAESKLKKLRKKAEGSLSAKNLGKHTTFVAEDDDPSSRLGSFHAPIAADHNIDVVVLPGLRSEDAVTDDNGDAASGSSGYIGARDKQIVSLSSNLGTKPSESANLLCRGRSTLTRNATDSESGFEVKRSRKMNYGLSRGKPLGGFVRKKRS